VVFSIDANSTKKYVPHTPGPAFTAAYSPKGMLRFPHIFPAHHGGISATQDVWLSSLKREEQRSDALVDTSLLGECSAKLEHVSLTFPEHHDGIRSSFDATWMIGRMGREAHGLPAHHGGMRLWLDSSAAPERFMKTAGGSFTGAGISLTDCCAMALLPRHQLGIAAAIALVRQSKPERPYAKA